MATRVNMIQFVWAQLINATMSDYNSLSPPVVNNVWSYMCKINKFNNAT